MKYFTAKRLASGNNEEWSRALGAYESHIATIQDRLPESVKRWHEMRGHRIPEHDDVLDVIERTGRDTAHVTGPWGRLEFVGVREFHCTADEPEVVWLYDELDLAPDSRFELRVLLEHGELKVVARELRLYSAGQRRYLIPDEPPPLAPMMFLERRMRHSKRPG